ncbi:LacI family DNA-binding transcriptional regulator [Lunatibacter salilacus]|uniref:LacI family DNA-binding transcriptional regulator n=1 Tax=Lunatibacter salilacus TaxID=2483804 RepID=UPI00131C52C1|nr:LacI family DNA-binding transcriptional regulator [Lunatibacter salilacus]
MTEKRNLSGVKEIARRANVSIATVDRVIHNRPGVSVKTKLKIEAIIKELNYQPNVLASRLASGKVFKLGVLIPKSSVYSDFWDAPLRGIQRAEAEIKQYGISVEIFFFDLPEKSTFTKAVQLLKSSDFDGILMSPSFLDESVDFLRHCQHQNIPVVFIDSNIEDQKTLSYIGPPLFQSGFLGAKLCQLCISYSSKVLLVNISKQSKSYNYLQIEKGFKQYFENMSSLQKCIKLDINEIDQPSIEVQLKKTFLQHPEIGAIFVMNSRVFAVAAYLERQNLPHIQLIGYDFISENQRYLKTGTINFLICHKPEEQGYKGIMSLYHHLALNLPVDMEYYMPIDIVTQENMDFYR